MKRVNSQEETNEIEVSQRSPKTKPIHKKVLWITSESLRLQQVKRRKISTWALTPKDLEINNEILKNLLKAMKPTKAIMKLDLQSGFPYDVTVTGFEKLGHGLTRFRTILQELRFDFYQSDWNKLFVEGLYYLCKGLKKLRLLKNLSINFGKWRGSSSAGFYVLGQTLKRLTSLKALNLEVSFESSEPYLLCRGMGRKRKPTLGRPLNLKDEDPDFIVKSLKNCRRLQTISFSFSGNGRINEEKFSQALKKLTSLRRISLLFRAWNMTESGLLCLSEGLGKLVFLKYVKLHFVLCQNLTNEGITKAKETLKELLSSTEVSVTKCRRRSESIV